MMDFTAERRVSKTRKPHQCNGCCRTIPVGSSASRWVGVSDGDFGSCYYHLECLIAEVALNALREHQHGDDWAQLADLDPEEHEWLIGEHPQVAEHMRLPRTPS